MPSRTTRLCGTCIFDSASTLALRLELLARAEDDVEQDQQRDDDPGRHLADDEAHRGDRDEHDVHRLAQLLERDLPDRRRLLAGDLVRAVRDSRAAASAWVRPWSASVSEGGDDGRLVLREPSLRLLGRGGACGSGAVEATAPIIRGWRMPAHHPDRVISDG